MKFPGQFETSRREDHACFRHAHRAREHDVAKVDAESRCLAGQFLRGSHVAQGSDQRIAHEVRAAPCLLELGDNLPCKASAFFFAHRTEPADLRTHAFRQQGIAAQRQ
jgi:hypothetical protein